MVIRFSAFHQALRSGQFPVRFVDRLNNNYGYPVFNYLYPMPFYLAEIPKLIGFNFTQSIKLVFILSTVISAIAMYWALSIKFSPTASLVGSTLYIFSPYRFLDNYVRGSLGEIVSFVFLPLILGCIFQVEKGNKKYFPLLSASVAGLILSHNVIAFFSIPVFELFFSSNSSFCIAIHFIINKFINIILLRKSFNKFILVFPDSFDKIACYANIKVS